MKKLLVCVMAFIGLFALAMTGIAQAEPDYLYSVCVVQADRADLAYSRTACDEKAEFALYQNGFLRPQNPNDLPFVKCNALVERAYLCFGVPWDRIDPLPTN